MKHRKSALTNAKNFPYVPAKLVENKWRIYIEFWVWSFKENDLVRKRVSKLQGKTQAEKIRNAKTQIKELNRLLAMGYMLDRKPQEEALKKLTVHDGIKIAVNAKGKILGGKPNSHYASFQRVFEQ